MKEQVLLLAARNIAEPTGEWRLVSTRAKALWLESGISTHVYALTRKKRLASTADVTGVEGMEVEHFTYSTMADLPWALTRMFFSVRRYLANFRPSAVLLSGVPTYALAPALRRLSIPIFMDIHAPLEEWLDYRPGFIRSDALTRVMYGVAKELERLAMRCSAGALVVSRPLGQYVRKQYHVEQIFTVPCGVVGRWSFGDIEPERRKWRMKLGLTRKTVVVYSGGLSKWQLVDGACELFKHMKDMDSDMELLLMTPNPQQARTIARHAGVLDQDLTSTFLSPTEVGKALAACDVGVMLRETKITNEMAFPNKFAEYLRAGLVIVTSPGLKEPSEIVTEHEIGLSIPPDQIRDLQMLGRLSDLIRRRADDLSSYYSKCQEAFDEHVEMRSAIRSFAEAISGETMVYATTHTK